MNHFDAQAHVNTRNKIENVVHNCFTVYCICCNTKVTKVSLPAHVSYHASFEILGHIRSVFMAIRFNIALLGFSIMARCCQMLVTFTTIFV